MKIGIDARWIFRETSGIGVYTAELIRHLAQIDRGNDYTLFFDRADAMRQTQAELGALGAANFKTCDAGCGIFSLRGQVKMPSLIKRLELDVFHSTNYMLPLPAFPRGRRGRTAAVITIHDLIPLVSPSAAPRALKARLMPLYRRLMREVVERSRLVITVSEHSRNDIIARLQCPPERVAAIPEGVAPRFRPPADSSRRFARRKKVVLWVGRRDPYKNLPGLIEAFAILRASSREALELRLVGPEDRRYPEADTLISALGLAGSVTKVGPVSDSAIVAEYQNASVFALPSFYEGFGLPVLEAMACGVPVVCSNRCSLPEICADAALLVEPGDSSALAAAMNRVLADPRLAMDLSARGLGQAAKFSWPETARRTLRAYEKAAQGGQPVPP